MKKYYKFDLDIVVANVVAIVVLVLSILLFLILKRGGNLLFPGTGIVIMLIYFILHEIFHGIGYSLFAKDKKNIKYGAVLEKSVFYAMCQEPIGKKAIIISLLFPLIFLTVITGIVGIIFNIDGLILLSILNLSGACGDILMLFLIFKLPDDIKYIDYDNNIGCYFISKHDLSKYKSFGIKYVESKEHKDSLINKKIPKIYISKQSVPILVFIIILSIILIIFDFMPLK